MKAAHAQEIYGCRSAPAQCPHLCKVARAQSQAQAHICAKVPVRKPKRKPTSEQRCPRASPSASPHLSKGAHAQSPVQTKAIGCCLLCRSMQRVLPSQGREGMTAGNNNPDKNIKLLLITKLTLRARTCSAVKSCATPRTRQKAPTWPHASALQRPARSRRCHRGLWRSQVATLQSSTCRHQHKRVTGVHKRACGPVQHESQGFGFRVGFRGSTDRAFWDCRSG